MQLLAEWLRYLYSGLQLMSGWEVIAVILAIAYLLLAMKESILCWYAALVSTAIYLFLFWDVSLLMESALQVYYLIMAVYGWYQWKYALNHETSNQPATIQTWSLQQHALTIVTVIIMSLISGVLLHKNTNAAWPFLDSFTTWGAVITTYMVTKKVLENWIYWLLIDALSIYLYLDRGLYLTAFLFFAYLIICIFGFVSWLKQYRSHHTPVYG